MPVSMQFKGIEFFLLVNLHFYDDLLKTSVDIVTVLVSVSNLLQLRLTRSISYAQLGKT